MGERKYLVFEEFEQGAQCCTNWGFVVDKVENAKLIKTFTITSYYSNFGGIFKYEWISIYEVTGLPVVIKARWYSLEDGIIHKEVDEYEVSKFLTWDEVVEKVKKALEFGGKFEEVIKRAEEIVEKDCKIEEVKDKPYRYVGKNVDSLYGDTYEKYQILLDDLNIVEALLYLRRAIPADVGYKQDYTKLLVI